MAFISLSINYNLLIPNFNKSHLASCCNGELNCTTPGNIHTPAPQKVEISWGCGGGGEGVWKTRELKEMYKPGIFKGVGFWNYTFQNIDTG